MSNVVPFDAERQRDDALSMGNPTRMARAAWRRRIASGEADLASILDPGREIPAPLRSMSIHQALMAQRRWGRARATRFLSPFRIGETRRLDALTDRQRRVLAERIREGRPRVEKVA